MTKPVEAIKKQIIAALSHPEAEDGLYFNNLIVVHEEEERPIVVGEESDIAEALRQMEKAGQIVSIGDGDTQIFKLAPGHLR